MLVMPVPGQPPPPPGEPPAELGLGVGAPPMAMGGMGGIGGKAEPSHVMGIIHCQAIPFPLSARPDPLYTKTLKVESRIPGLTNRADRRVFRST
jgi:hypothetical protein